AGGGLMASGESGWVEMVRRGSLQAAKDWRRDALDEPSGGQPLPASIRHLRAVPISRTAQFAFSADHFAARARADGRSLCQLLRKTSCQPAVHLTRLKREPPPTDT